MKYTKFVLLITLISFCNPVFSSVTTDDAISPEYIQIQGYSKFMADSVKDANLRSNGKKPVYKKTPKTYITRFLEYFDPAIDDYSLQHDIKTNPAVTDL